MSFEIEQFDVVAAIIKWVTAVISCASIGLFVAAVVSFLAHGPRGFGRLRDAVKRGVVDLTHLSTRRITAIARLAVRESRHRKALYVFGVFVPLFMFGGWFLQGSEVLNDKPAKPFVVFVLTVIRWLLVPVAILLSCWGLPADIKDRSLHTVVTKPVRRSEVIIGRMLGYGFVTTIVLAAMSAVGYIWIIRVVPHRAQEQLISRVPVYANSLYFLDNNGDEAEVGKNVGDPWEYRSYIEGQTNERAGFRFDNISEDSLALDDAGNQVLKLEYKFEAFRTYMGTIDEGVRFRLELINTETDLRVPHPPTTAIEIQEFAEGAEETIVRVPRSLQVDVDDDGEADDVDLIADLVQDGHLLIEVSCEDGNQYLGVAQPDLFIRKVDRSFEAGYFKSMLAIWMMVLLIIIIGTTASCFLKGPVATFLTLGLVIMGGTGLRTFLVEQLEQHNTEGQVLGGGPLESMYRLVTAMNQQTELPESSLTDTIKLLDPPILEGLDVLRHVIPNFNYYNSTKYVANGFDVPWSTIDAALLPGIATTFGYLIPCIVLGYFSLQVRELEAK